ncbi:hypothetical protein J5N97_012874 [Dioscorea zingiberensis]|uniref:SHSP domain-containing protein n=1 Tax=Dioscorea zingiberensis TaxID=325984 RepID=A0A9D5HI54_9LILI|nr:hypothetical protein J5N97_012874 [Dioscorea zingiberensis]
MESQIVRRRVGRILNHVAACEEVLPSNAHLFPLNCSSTLNTIGPRYDNRLLFARQGSAYQACFMQQASGGQNTVHDISCQQSLRPTCSSRTCDSSYQRSEIPLFSRQALMVEQSVKQDFSSSSEAPKFARSISGNNERKEFSFNLARHTSSVCRDSEWTPRVDVVESASNYLVMVELPGVNIPDIRVEVDDRNLTVSGERFNQQRGTTHGSENLNQTFHRREIIQGPYRVVWPLPKDVNKDSVSAEFVNGFLQITLPKL